MLGRAPKAGEAARLNRTAIVNRLNILERGFRMSAAIEAMEGKVAGFIVFSYPFHQPRKLLSACQTGE
jgi:predicted alpha/beta-hydrolase family hydrolase